MPPRFVRAGFLQSLDMVAGVIQRAWYTSKGNYAAFIVAAARAKEEHMQMLNDNATIIQHNTAGICGISSTSLPCSTIVPEGSPLHSDTINIACGRPPCSFHVHRYIRKIQRCVRKWMERRFLLYRFKARKAFMLVFRRKQLEGAVAIQRSRAYREESASRRRHLLLW